MALCPPMGLALIYTWSQHNRNKQVSFFFVNIKSQWMPYAVVGVAFLSGGPMIAMEMVSSLIFLLIYKVPPDIETESLMFSLAMSIV